MRRIALFAALLAAAQFPTTPASADTLADLRARPPQDEVIYFVLPDRFDNGDPANDRGGRQGDRLATGYDPTAKNFWNGGDFAGLTRRLDYIKGLGATAIWLAPVFANKIVQGAKGDESAGFHGYWITDFTRPDPHLGTEAEFKALVDAAHAKGLKVYLDIVANHTADVIQYRECVGRPCDYRGLADYPYSRRGGVAGAAINDGFAGDHVATAANWARLTRPDFAYTPFVPDAEKAAKSPAWLNDPIHYHNRGNSLFRNESSTYGDFVGLDDLATEHPRVVAGMIDIYGGWIDRFGIDGYRIDTAQHVNPEFWHVFVPAMLARAKARGIPDFHIFGEVAVDGIDVGRLARHTRALGMPQVLDFAMAGAAIEAIAGSAPTSRLARLFADDVLYEGGEAGAARNPTFIGNHDMGRFAMLARKANPNAPKAELEARVLLAHALMLFSRGVPTLYYGDEQGFVGTGNDNDARQPMFGSKVAAYNADIRLGTAATTATPAFDPAHPFYRAIAAMAAVRSRDVRLRRGTTVVRAAGDAPGLFAFARVVPGQPGETLVVLNTANTALRGNIAIDPALTQWRALSGPCPAAAAAPGSLAIALAPLSFAVCTSDPAP